MYKLLKTYPLRTNDSKLTLSETHQLQKLINDKQSLSGIAMKMNRFDTIILDEIIIQIRSGSAITKSHLKSLIGVNDELLNHIKSNVTDYDFANLDDIPCIQLKFAQNSQITEKMLALVMHYLKVRQFLRSINVPYFDIDENRLINGHELLGSKVIDKNDSPIKKSQENMINSKIESQLEESFKLNDSITTHQNGQSSWNDHMSEEENFLTQVMDNLENKTDSSMMKPLIASQNPNENNNLNKFKAIPPSKMYAQAKIQSQIEEKAKPKTVASKKRAAPVQKIQYLDSDGDGDGDDGDDSKQPQTKRILPQWLSTKKPAPSNTNQLVAARKRKFF